MVVAVTDLISLRWVVEGSFGAGADSAAMADMRITGESLEQTTENRRSNELRDDAQIEDDKRVNIGVTGSVEGLLSYETWDSWMQYALRSSGWSTVKTNTDITYSMANADNSINDSANQFVVDGFVANQWVEIRGFTDSANNGFFKLTSVAAGKMVLAGGTVATEAAGDSVTITMGAQITNGTTLNSMSIEREYSSPASEFVEYKGCVIDGMTIGINAKELVTVSFDIMGKSATSGTATAGDGSPTAVNANLTYSAQENVTTVWENNSSIEGTLLNFSVRNNYRMRDMVLGTLGADSAGAGKFECSGELQMLYESKTIMDKYLNYTDTSIAVVLEDASGNAYLIEVVEANYTSGRRVAGGENEDIIADMAFAGHRDSSEDVTLRIAKFAA